MSGAPFDADGLRAAGRDLAVPFQVQLTDGRLLQMQRLLRLLPGKRIAGEASLDGRRVFAKLFVAKAGERHWQAESEGIGALAAAGIPTPEVLLADRLQGGGHVIVSSFVEDAESLAAGWARLDAPPAGDPGALDVLAPVLAMLAQMHRAGLAQRDLHLGNFLRSGHRLLVIDGDSVTVAAAPLPAFAAAENLGVLLAQLPATWDGVAPALLAEYQSAGGIASVDAAMLCASIEKVRAWRLQDYLKKSLRDCTLFSVARSTNRFVAVLRTERERLADVLAVPDKAIDTGLPLKSGNTCTVAQVALPGGDIVVKRYNLKSVGHALSRLWRPSRAWHSWREGHRLALYGIATPAPLALVEERFGPLRRRAWLFAEHCPGVSLSRHLSPESPPPAAEALALTTLFELLCRLRITHGDMKASNLLWHAGRIWLIDLDACTQHRSEAAWRKAWRRDRARLLRNWPADSGLAAWLDRALPPA